MNSKLTTAADCVRASLGPEGIIYANEGWSAIVRRQHANWSAGMLPKSLDWISYDWCKYTTGTFIPSYLQAYSQSNSWNLFNRKLHPLL